MAHECDDCGETFETLSRLRLHDCSGGQPADSSLDTTDTHSDEGTVTAELDAQLARVDDRNVTAVHDVIATFETSLSDTLDHDDRGETYRDVFWPYYERVADTLDAATQAEGWALLGDVVEAYDPTVETEVPQATPAIANAVGRHVIRTRMTTGVAAIPVDALAYLDDVAMAADESEDVVREEIHAYGWGIGHPDHPVVDRLRARAPEDIFSVNATLEHAFYADQYAAVDALERMVLDDPVEETLSQINRDDVSYARVLLDCVYGLQTDDHWPTTPRFWNWHEELDYTFELDEAVDGRIREMVVEAGFDDELPPDWTFRDLGL